MVIKSLFAALVLCLFATSFTFGDKIAGIDLGITVPDGVYCEINEVKLFALSAEDCQKAGGIVTHTVTTTVEPAGDNPNQEPEIQRTKDKEPVAP